MSRNVSVDIAKGVGILFVVYGHTFCPFKDYIYLFHMPLFFLLSGFLYKDNNSIRESLISKFKTLIIPYGYFLLLVNSIFILFLFFLDEPIHLYPGMLIRPYGVSLTFWFFLALFNVSLFFKLIDSLHSNYIKIVIIVFLFFTGVLLSNFRIKIPLFIDSGFTALVFYSVGFYYKKNKLIKFYCYFISLIIAVHYFYRDILPVVDLKENMYNDPMCIFISLGLSFLVVDLSNILANYKLSRIVFSYLGNKSLVIFSLHILVLEFIYLFFPKNNEMYALLNAILAIIIVLYLNRVCKIETHINYLQNKTNLILDFIIRKTVK